MLFHKCAGFLTACLALGADSFLLRLDTGAVFLQQGEGQRARQFAERLVILAFPEVLARFSQIGHRAESIIRQQKSEISICRVRVVMQGKLEAFGSPRHVVLHQERESTGHAQRGTGGVGRQRLVDLYFGLCHSACVDFRGVIRVLSVFKIQSSHLFYKK